VKPAAFAPINVDQAPSALSDRRHMEGKEVSLGIAIRERLLRDRKMHHRDASWRARSSPMQA